MKFILIILDGFGLREDENGNAYALGNTPNLDNLLQKKPLAVVETSGVHVGLPDGIMGNSEVGHTNIGAGRIVKQDLVRINDDIKNDQLKNNLNLQSIFNHVIENDSTLHLMGLLSDGGVHSHIDHFKYILNAAKNYGIKNNKLAAVVYLMVCFDLPNQKMTSIYHLKTESLLYMGAYLDQLPLVRLMIMSGHQAMTVYNHQSIHSLL